MSPTNSFIFAGERSADLYGGKILTSLKQHLPQEHFWGVGGPSMHASGFNAIMGMEKFQVMGFSDVIKALGRLYLQFRRIKKAILKNNPHMVLCIDQPSFGMKLAKSLRKSGYKGKIIQLVAPTVWAWKPKRAEILAKDFDLLLTLFDFEPPYFAHTQLPTVFVGHPITELIEENQSNSLPIDATRPLLSIFPGSRPAEIKRNLQKQLDAAKIFCTHYPETQIAISCSQAINLKDVLVVPFEARYELMRKSTFALAKSGTVTLELALHQVPTVVSYELSQLNYLMAKYLMKLQLPYFSIVNILSQKELFFERIRPPVTAGDLAECLLTWQRNPADYTRCRQECGELKRRLVTDLPPTQKITQEILTRFF